MVYVAFYESEKDKRYSVANKGGMVSLGGILGV